jgi:hypothetical protein
MIAWVFAANPAPYLSIVLGVCGLGGLVFTALRFRRDDTTALLGQQSTIMGEMKDLNNELRLTTVALREERDRLKEQVDRLTGEITKLRGELQEGRFNG